MIFSLRSEFGHAISALTPYMDMAQATAIVDALKKAGFSEITISCFGSVNKTVTIKGYLDLVLKPEKGE